MTSEKTLSGTLYAAFAAMALAVFSVSAQAADPEEITIYAPHTHTVGRNDQTVGRNDATDAPIHDTTVKVAVSYDPVTLTTNSGIALLKDSVADAARKACNAAEDAADSLPDDGGTCVRAAISSAQAQVDAAITMARSNTGG
jgi:UrcA family protein